MCWDIIITRRRRREVNWLNGGRNVASNCLSQKREKRDGQTDRQIEGDFRQEAKIYFHHIHERERKVSPENGSSWFALKAAKSSLVKCHYFLHAQGNDFQGFGEGEKTKIMSWIKVFFLLAACLWKLTMAIVASLKSGFCLSSQALQSFFHAPLQRRFCF